MNLALVVLILISCENESKNLKNGSSLDKKLKKSVEATKISVNQKKMNGECFLKLRRILEPIILTQRKDSITSIYQISTQLFDKHYSEYEINRFIYFKSRVFNSLNDTYDNRYFAIDKKNSELVFLNYLQRFKILTVDHHLKIGQNFTFLNELNCIKEFIEPYNATDTTIYYQNKTFDLSNNAIWVVDSIDENTGKKCLFNKQDSIRVFLNKMFIINDDTLDFYFENNKLQVMEDPISIISSSQYHKILYDSNKNYIFMSKINE